MHDYQDYYLDRCRQHELWLQHCPECEKTVFYPRALCPYCLQTKPEWRRVSGRGRLHSYTIINVSALPEFADAVPYVYALIELEEGVRMASNLVECQLEALKVDMRVELTWLERAGLTLPAFKPV